MPVVTTPYGYNEDQLYVNLQPALGHPLFLKCEGFNFAGSIKLKAATEMVEAAERSGTLRPDSILVESSSGNLGVALSMIAASKGYRFLCVTDRRCNLTTRLLMEALGARVHVIDNPDPEGGLVGARINYVRRVCAADSCYVWLNQYSNPNNWMAHFRRTAPAIARQFPSTGRSFRGRRNHRHPDGLRQVLPRVAPPGADRRSGHGGLGVLRDGSRTAQDSRTRHGHPAAAARRVVCR